MLLPIYLFLGFSYHSRYICYFFLVRVHGYCSLEGLDFIFFGLRSCLLLPQLLSGLSVIFVCVTHRFFSASFTDIKFYSFLVNKRCTIFKFGSLLLFCLLILSSFSFYLCKVYFLLANLYECL